MIYEKIYKENNHYNYHIHCINNYSYFLWDNEKISNLDWYSIIILILEIWKYINNNNNIIDLFSFIQGNSYHKDKSNLIDQWIQDKKILLL